MKTSEFRPSKGGIDRNISWKVGQYLCENSVTILRKAGAFLRKRLHHGTHQPTPADYPNKAMTSGRQLLPPERN